MREQTAAWVWEGVEAYSLQDGVSNEGIGYWHGSEEAFAGRRPLPF
jgi:hypothetical protein